MLLKVQIEELIDKDVLKKYCDEYGWDIEYMKEIKHEEVYINESEAEEWGFMAKTRDMFGEGGKE